MPSRAGYVCSLFFPEQPLILVWQIRAELVHHNIRLYPFDTDENDEEELAQNDTIRVCHITSS